MNNISKKWMKWISLFTLTALCIGFAGNRAVTKAETAENHKIADGVYIGNVYVGGMTEEEAVDAISAYAQSVDDGVCIKYRSFDGESEVELFTINPDENKSIKSLVVSDDFIIYDLGPGNYEDGVDMRVIWNRNTGETQETIVYR